KWIRALRRKNWKPEDNVDYRICSEHFLPSDYKDIPGNRRYLKRGAIPSVFPTFPRYYQSAPKKERRELIRQINEPTA
ncbi:Uncharacterized protein FKW44_005814, partial [Caligus rogercresseyi]